MKFISLSLIMTGMLLLAIVSCKNDIGTLPVETAAGECDTIIYYVDEIVPIMKMKCATSGCHEPGFSSGDLTSYAPLKTFLDNGKFVDRVFDIQDMPPAGNDLLTEIDKKKINCWIKQGYPNNSKDPSASSNSCSATVSYSTEIAPIISANCSSTVCHGVGSSNGDYSDYSGLKAAADNGILYTRVITNNSLHDPPVVLNPPLNSVQMNKINCWIQQGASNN